MKDLDQKKNDLDTKTKDTDFTEKQVLEILEIVDHFILKDQKAYKLITDTENKLNELDLSIQDKDVIMSAFHKALDIGFYLGLTYVFTDIEILKSLYEAINEKLKG